MKNFQKIKNDKIVWIAPLLAIIILLAGIAFASPNTDQDVAKSKVSDNTAKRKTEVEPHIFELEKNEEQTLEDVDVADPAISRDEEDIEKIQIDEVPKWTMVATEDTSYAGCQRNSYKAHVPDGTSKEELERVLIDMYNSPVIGGQKTFIYLYYESQTNVDEELYKGRLFMNPDCDVEEDYKIDFDFFDTPTFVELESL